MFSLGLFYPQATGIFNYICWFDSTWFDSAHQPSMAAKSISIKKNAPCLMVCLKMKTCFSYVLIKGAVVNPFPTANGCPLIW